MSLGFEDFLFARAFDIPSAKGFQKRVSKWSPELIPARYAHLLFAHQLSEDSLFAQDSTVAQAFPVDRQILFASQKGHGKNRDGVLPREKQRPSSSKKAHSP